MHSEAIDQLLSRALERPVRFEWAGSFADSLVGRFDGVSLELAGVATAWLSIERLTLRAAHAHLHPGLPARLAVESPEVAVTVGQRDVDPWVAGLGLPFGLELTEKGLRVHTEVAGLPVSDFETRLEVAQGWFVLRPQRAAVLGVPNALARFFRTYLPLPPLAAGVRLTEIEHGAGELTLHFGVDDFEEDLTPGMIRRLRRRLVPWVG
ncbi:MAG: hypothetical protein AAF430_24115 [Myxococcota bacterium]